MRKILLTIILSLFTFVCHSQISYKRYDVVSIDSNQNIPKYLVGYGDTGKSDTIGVVLTIQQAQKIDNDLELLILYRQAHTNCDSTVNFLVQVVEDYKKMNIIAQQTFKAYEATNKDLKSQISNLNQQVAIKEEQLIVKDGFIKDKNSIIDVDKLQITHLKHQKDKLVIGGVAVSAGLIYMILGHPGIR